jgi:hypothetical protein
MPRRLQSQRRNRREDIATILEEKRLYNNVMRWRGSYLQAVVCVASLASASALAQTSFDEHYALAKRSGLGPREAAFAKQCGVERAASRISYGRSFDEGWTFKPMASVGKGRADAEMDFLGNAELWSVAGKPRLLNAWFLVMDVGNSSNVIFCLDENGRVTSQETLNVHEPVDGTGDGWRHLHIKSFPSSGKPQTLTNEYLDKAGNPIAAPKLDKDDIAEANRKASSDLARDIIRRFIGEQSKADWGRNLTDLPLEISKVVR